MQSVKMMALWQQQLTLERTNEAFYRVLAARAEFHHYPGAAVYFAQCAQDEREHGLRCEGVLIDRNQMPAFDALPAIPDPGQNYKTWFDTALQRERVTTAAIVNMCQIACNTEMDMQSMAALQNPEGEDWPGFIQEQTDSERELTDYINSIERLGPDGVQTFDEWLEEKYSD